MAEHMGTEKSSLVLDWLESLSTDASCSLLNLDSEGGPAGPPELSQSFPFCSSPISHTHHPALCATPRMTRNYLMSSQAMETYPNGEETPASFHASQSRVLSAESPPYETQLQPAKLRFLELNEWDEHNSYDEVELTCLHYSIEWKVSINSKVISRDTEPDLVLLPVAYWHVSLKPKLDKLLQKKVPQNRHIRCDDTTVVVTVTDRSERDLSKRFDDIDIDWSMIQRQFMKWGELFRSGKKLRLDISFNYIDAQPQTASTTKRGSKRGSGATQRMLVEKRTAVVSHLSGETSIL
jgi:hypothetical protein